MMNQTSTSLRAFVASSLVAGLAFSTACTKSETETATTQAAVTEAPKAKSGPLVYAASSHIRVVDTAKGIVIKNIDLQKAVRQIIAHDSGLVAVAASDGVRIIDSKTHTVQSKLTETPARSIEFSSDGSKLWVLEHRVEVKADKTRTVHPFELVTFSFPGLEELNREVVGERIVYARPAGEGIYGVRVTESAELSIVAPGQGLTEGQVADMGKRGVRQGMTTDGTDLYLPLEGPDGVAVMHVDLTNGRTQLWPVPAAKSVRGLAKGEDGVYLNAVDGLFVLSGGEARKLTTLEGAHVGVTLLGQHAVLARTVDKPGGSLTTVDLKSGEVVSKAMLEDISPWALAALPAR